MRAIRQYQSAGLIVAAFAVVATAVTLSSRAATSQAVYEAESGLLGVGVSPTVDAAASGGRAVQFAATASGSVPVPIPVSGAYWGWTSAAAQADPYPLTGCTSGTNHAKLECKVQWAASQQSISLPMQSDGKYHSPMEHMFTRCDDADSKFQSGGSVWNSAHVPGRQVLMINMKCGTWSEIANGNGTTVHDNNLRRKAELLGQIGIPVILTWHHEPENDSCGVDNSQTPDHYRKAYRQFATDVRSVGATNIATGWILMGWTFDLDNNTVFTTCSGVGTGNGPLRNPENWWPGDDAVDWIMNDPYADSGKTFTELVENFVAWSNAPCPASGHPTVDWNCTNARASKPLGLAEYSVTGLETAAYRANWMDDQATKMASFPEIKAYAWWSDQTAGTGTTPWWVDYPTTDANRTTLKAFARLTNTPWIANTSF